VLSADQTNQSYVSTYGVYAVPLADDAQELATLLFQLYAKQVSTIPWVPKTWIGNIASINGVFNPPWNQKVVVLPASIQTLKTYGTPSFLNTTEKVNAWNKLNEKLLEAYNAYANKRLVDGRTLMVAASNDVAFWNWAVKIATVLALPVTAAKAAVEEGTKTLALPIILVTGLLLAFAFAKRK
jgi:hypothetical protein